MVRQWMQAKHGRRSQFWREICMVQAYLREIFHRISLCIVLIYKRVQIAVHAVHFTAVIFY